MHFVSAEGPVRTLFLRARFFLIEKGNGPAGAVPRTGAAWNISWPEREETTTGWGAEEILRGKACGMT